ncbi:MAG: RNA 2',3'-cyclic phosphodiesterase [Blastocatellia bacterium]
MRTFIAIEIPAEIKTALSRLQTELRRAGAEVSWTKPENIHLTLKFLGEIEETLVSEIERACVDVAAEFQPFTLDLDSTGVFPNARQPRVLWAGLAGETEKAVEIQRRLDERLAAIRFDREEKSFRPHLTIGRVKSNRRTRELLALTRSYQLPRLAFDVKEIVVMKSELLPAGARYTSLARAGMRLS